MARDVDKNVPLYFYDLESGIFTGEAGASGDSDDYILPSRMTPIEPPTFETNEQAIFDIDLQTWSVEYINPYDGWTQTEKDIWDAAQAKQAAIDAAQDLVDEKFAETIDLTIQFLEEKFDLTPVKQAYLDGATTIEELKTVLVDTLSMTAGQKAIVTAYHTDYAAWLAAKEA